MKPLSEEIIKKNILEQLKWDDKVDADHIQIEIEGNTVILKGTVNSYLGKLSAARDVLQVAGDCQVINDLLVDVHPDHKGLSDKEITEHIQESLKWHSRINPVNLQVETVNGIVTLSGTVSRSAEKSEAGKIAGTTKGVVEVVNAIHVKPASVRSDASIQKDILRVLERSALVDEEMVQISVENGIVRLSGSVAYEPIKNEICDKAMNTSGVVDVIDEITIR